MPGKAAHVAAFLISLIEDRHILEVRPSGK
jgi:hypothetical protein